MIITNKNLNDAEKIRLWCETSLLEKLKLATTKDSSTERITIVISSEIPDTSEKNFCRNENLKIYLLTEYLKELGYKVIKYYTEEEGCRAIASIF